jgi:KaiC/GvpD/RAD55 family RecA-like ATPase
MPSPDLLLAPRGPTPGFGFQSAASRPGGPRLGTGVHRLDLLLGGGWEPGSATLLYGPPFCGKQQLLQQSVVRAAASGVPTTVVVHTVGARAMSARLRLVHPSFAQAEERGLVHYVDMHSRALGEPTDHPNTTYVEDSASVAEVLRALQSTRPGGADGQPPPAVPGLLALESASTVLVDLGPARAFTFLRTVVGRTLAQGGVALLCLEGGMHAESEVHMAKHLCAGMVEMRKKGEAHCLHVDGLETAYARPGWVEYEFSPRTFRVTGSFASRSIA